MLDTKENLKEIEKWLSEDEDDSANGQKNDPELGDNSKL